MLAIVLGALSVGEPLGRYSHCSVRMNDDMYTYGGRGFASADDRQNLVIFSDMWAFSLSRMAWEPVEWRGEGVSPGPRSSHACAALSESPPTLLVYGGMTETPAGQQRVVDELWRFDLTTRTAGVWSKLRPTAGSDTPGSRSDASLVAANGKLVYLIGGCESRVARPDAWRFSVPKRRWERVPFGATHVDLADGSADDEDDGGEGGVDAAESNGTDVSDGGDNVTETKHALPAARCAQVATKGPGSDVILFGGRVSVTVRKETRSGLSRSEEMWKSLADTWKLHLADVDGYVDGGNDRADGDEQARNPWEPIAMTPQARRGGGGERRSERDAERATAGSSVSEALLLNRSDHAAIVHGETLYVFGGLFTDLEQRTVYIMKDLVALSLRTRTWARLAWGPAWRFGHSIVDDSANGRFLLYGGAGGMEVFNDVWAYSYASGEWAALNLQSGSSQYPTLLMSILMGGAGFMLCVCMMLSLLLLRTSHRLFSRRGTPTAAHAATQAAHAPAPALRGAGDEAIHALPVLRWAVAKAECERQPAPRGEGTWSDASVGDEVTDVANAGSAAVQPAHAAQAPAADGVAVAARDGAAADGAEDAPAARASERDDERSLDASVSCVVCLMEFEEEVEVCVLPCRHVFHTECIHRWLRQEGSCPQCRHRIAPPSAAKEGEAAAEASAEQAMADVHEGALADALAPQGIAALGGQPPPADVEAARGAGAQQADLEAGGAERDRRGASHAGPRRLFSWQPAARGGAQPPSAAFASTEAGRATVAVELAQIRR